MKKIFLDGSAGTTGLRIRERLEKRSDIELISLPEELRKDVAARKKAINSADFVFLCLPDSAALEAAELCENDSTVIIDASTAHRTADGWTYGFPELHGMREKVKDSKRIANPGCHASGFIALAAPLVCCGIIKADEQLSCFSVTGYSGGGKKMIADYEPIRDNLLRAPRQYGLGQTHKHLPEMAKVCGLLKPPIFSPVVAPFYAGMEVCVPLSPAALGVKLSELKDIYRSYYKDGLVSYNDAPDENGFLSACALTGRDDMELSVIGNDDRAVLV